MEDSEALATAAAEVAKRDKEKIVAAKRSLKQIVTEKVALLKKAEGDLKKKLTAIELREDDESKELRQYSPPVLPPSELMRLLNTFDNLTFKY